MLVDTHAHLDDLKYEEDRQEVIARAKAEGTTRIITMGDTMESSFNAIKIADNLIMPLPNMLQTKTITSVIIATIQYSIFP